MKRVSLKAEMWSMSSPDSRCFLVSATYHGCRAEVCQSYKAASRSYRYFHCRDDIYWPQAHDPKAPTYAWLQRIAEAALDQIVAQWPHIEEAQT